MVREAFPNLVLVLQGYGVTIDLVGDTYINEKTGITSSTFRTIPDAPVGTFELTLPQGPNSALTANTSLCKLKSLSMPTEFARAERGAEVKRSTAVTVEGCGKTKKTKKAKKAKHKKAKHRARRSRKARHASR